MLETATRLPAEWEEQDAILLAWPHAGSDWQPILEEIIAVFVELTRRIVSHQAVLIATPEPAAVAARLNLAGVPPERVRICDIPTNDTWSRDFGPLTIRRNGRPVLLDFGFNGWGLKFPANHDNLATGRLHAAGCFGATPREIVGLILEGGSIESDGQGTILTSSACLLSGNRNPHLDQGQIEQALFDHLGATRVLWLEHGYLAGDDTDAHIDTLARLCPDQTIAYVRCDDPRDEHFAELGKMEAQLRQLRTAAGKPFRLIPLPWPQASYDEDGQRLPATYANFLVINGAVLVPTYADPADDQALAALAEAFPEREIIGIDCRPVIWQHGSLHCVTMQIPQGVLP
jgi:agmatine deiminase